MTQQTSDKTYIVAYGYQQTFYLTEQEAKALIKAREQRAEIVKFSDRVFSTNFSWLVPKSEIEYERLNEEELSMAEKVADWLTRPIHELSFTSETALNYTKKLVSRIGLGQVERLWDEYANGTYPSAKRFLMEAKQISSTEIPVRLPEGENND